MRWGLSKEVKEFMKPKDLFPTLGISHNWGSWFYFNDHIVIRDFGNLVTPRLLPITIPKKVAFLEIMQ